MSEARPSRVRKGSSDSEEGRQRRRVLIIVNPVAGQDDGRDIESLLLRAFEDGGHDVELHVTQGEGDAMRWASEAAGWDQVVVAGGDGTVMEVISGLVKGKVTAGLSQIPRGTANLLARALAIPTDFDDALALALGGGVVVEMDVGHLPDHDRYFALVAGAGWDAALIEGATREMKDKMGFFAYVLTGLRNLFGLKNSRIELSVDGELKRFEAHTVMVLNVGEIYGSGVAVGPDLSPHDGKLNVAVISPRTVWGILKLLLCVISKRFESDGDLRYFSASRFEVEATPPLKLEIDGECIGQTPFRVDVVPAGVHLVVPPEYAEAKKIESRPLGASGSF